MRPKHPPYKRYTALAFFGVALVAVLKLLGGGDRSLENPEILGAIWSNLSVTSSTAEAPSRIYFLTKEERQLEEKVGTSRRSIIYRTVKYTRYRLRSRDAKTGELTGDVVVADVRNARHSDAPEIVGILPGALWTYRHGIELRDPNTLSLVASSETLRQMNPHVAATLPGHRDSYRICAVHGALVVKANDLQFHQVDALGKFSPADTELMLRLTGQKSVADAFRYLPAAGRSRGTTSVNDFLVTTFLTSTRQWYSLISEEKLQSLTRWPRTDNRPYGEEWRQFYNVEYKLDDRNHPEIDPEAVKRVGEGRFLNGAFLQRTDHQVWDVAEPSSTLVLHKKNLERNTAWNLARLARNGEILFDVSTGLADLHTVTDAGDSLVLYGFADFNEPTAERPHLLVFVDPKTGQFVVKNESLVPEET